MKRRVFLIVVLLCAASAFADGGRLRFRQAAGPFVVTLFTTPDPLTTGRADFSVAVERDGALVQDADIDLVLTPEKDEPIMLHASHAQATSKWLQAANFTLPRRGRWRVDVKVRRGHEFGECSGDVEVGANWARNVFWDVLPVPIGALLFVLHQRRKGKYQRERQRRSASAGESRSQIVSSRLRAGQN
jgi:hypothetical protein